ncbi:hypothetical protein GALL_472890 [mine drainage metagenome]|uniref:Protein containing DUF1814 n=1 Tax=mine drainage metagenome TaxID=410659 RepID=A0A1J5PHZ8_9ZZZZ
MPSNLVSSWKAVLEIAGQVPLEKWVLIGGQMVALHALIASTNPPRLSLDIDLLVHVLAPKGALGTCSRLLQEMDFQPEMDLAGNVYRFRSPDGGVIDLLAPEDVPADRLPLIRGGHTVLIEGGRQALNRTAVVTVHLESQKVDVPVPDLLGALVLKSAAWAVDSRDRARHSQDAAFLVSLMRDPRLEQARFAGSDRHRLHKLDSVLKDPNAREWALLGDAAEDGYAAWRILLG